MAQSRRRAERSLTQAVVVALQSARLRCHSQAEPSDWSAFGLGIGNNREDRGEQTADHWRQRRRGGETLPSCGCEYLSDVLGATEGDTARQSALLLPAGGCVP